MHSFVIKGPAAQVKWVYHEAASLSSWSVVPDAEGGGTLTATVIQMDTLRAAQQPLTFVVQRPGSTWRWPIRTLQIAGASLTATLGPQE